MADKKQKGGCIVMRCTCENKGQDELHGKQMRVHNIAEGDGKAYCTVCQSPRRRYNSATSIDANPVFKQVAIVGAPSRVGKTVNRE